MSSKTSKMQHHSSADLFGRFLEWEHRRQARAKGPVCILSIQLQEIRPEIFALVRRDIRDADMHMLIGNEMRIILVDTTKEGARRAGKRLHGIVRENIKSRPYQRPARPFKVSLRTWDYSNRTTFANATAAHRRNHA